MNIEARVTNLIQEAGAFFAFGQEQYDRQAVNGLEYVNKGSSLYVPKENADKLMKDIEEAHRQNNAAYVAGVGVEKIIEHEYFNHECHYTSDTTDARDALKVYVKQFPELFTEEVMERVFKKCWRKAVDNDLF